MEQQAEPVGKRKSRKVRKLMLALIFTLLLIVVCLFLSIVWPGKPIISAYSVNSRVVSINSASYKNSAVACLRQETPLKFISEVVASTGSENTRVTKEYEIRLLSVESPSAVHVQLTDVREKKAYKIKLEVDDMLYSDVEVRFKNGETEVFDVPFMLFWGETSQFDGTYTGDFCFQYGPQKQENQQEA